MTGEEAIRLMAVYEAATATLAPALNMNLSDPVESKEVRFAHGELVMAIYEKGMRRIIKQYPDLDPDLESDLEQFLKS